MGDAAVPALGGADGGERQRDFTAETQRRGEEKGKKGAEEAEKMGGGRWKSVGWRGTARSGSAASEGIERTQAWEAGEIRVRRDDEARGPFLLAGFLKARP